MVADEEVVQLVRSSLAQHHVVNYNNMPQWNTKAIIKAKEIKINWVFLVGERRCKVGEINVE